MSLIRDIVGYFGVPAGAPKAAPKVPAGLDLPQEQFVASTTSPQAPSLKANLLVSTALSTAAPGRVTAQSQAALPQGVALASPALCSPLGVVLQKASLESLREQSQGSLPDVRTFAHSALQATQQMAKTGGVVELPEGIPTLILTDIHGRRDYIMEALEGKTPQGEPIFELLKQGKINVVCLGDGMHGEGRVAQRWQVADTLANDDLKRGTLLQEQTLGVLDPEMTESLGTMKMVMDLKNSFPDNFHYIRGNHDEVDGNFYKFARQVGESTLARQWMEQRLGSDFLNQYRAFEEAMPLVIKGKGFVASHAAPGKVLQRSEIEARDEAARMNLTWTDNARRDAQGTYVWENDSNLAKLQHNLKELDASESVWLVGHRVVTSDEHGGRYRSQFDGQLVQLNAPNDNVVAFIPADGQFNPEVGIRWI